MTPEQFNRRRILRACIIPTLWRLGIGLGLLTIVMVGIGVYDYLSRGAL